MPRRNNALDARTVDAAVRTLRQLPPKILIALVLVGAVGFGVWWFVQHRTHANPTNNGATTTQRDSLLFCWWNVENLFDDKEDKRNNIDREYDGPFSGNEHLRKLKYDHIAGTLVAMDEGRGPDVIAICEVESPRAAELLMETLNKKLDDAKADPALKYKAVAMRELDGGRHIAPAVITRLNVSANQTRLHGSRLRILESHLNVNGHDLAILATHWTSQLKQQDGGNGGGGREKYANTTYEVFRAAAKANPACDLIVCGDFNDTPDCDAVVKHLGGTGDKSKVVETANEPRLLDLLAGKDPAKFGTLFYGGKPLIYDHICLSPGMLNPSGWSADPDSVQTITAGLMKKGATRREPWRFESPGKEMPDDKRGFSDHFPVTVRLKVAAPAP